MNRPNDRQRKLHQRAGRVFTDASRMEPSAREAFLDSECEGDAELRNEVESLLKYSGDTGPFVDPALGAGFRLPDRNSLAAIDADVARPTKIGSYRIVDFIASGGTGTVYLAEQALTGRQVALKLLRPVEEGDAESLFRREVRVLGRFEHPYVARILEAGVHSLSGRKHPFIAMEYVEGEPVTRWCRDQKVPFVDRLLLLARIARAVHYAHQRGILHRDLKPDNILVDSSGRPRILDFGVARSIDGPTDADPTLRGPDESGRLIGTLAYMSPEQFDCDPEALDTRTDVYSLGVIGYRMLTSQRPYELTDDIAEMAQRVRTYQPKPIDPLEPIVGSDAERVLHRAMEKDREKRYSSADDLAADLERVVNYQPISAREHTPWYLAERLVRRRIGWVTLFGLVSTLLAALLVGIVIFGLDAGHKQRLSLVAKNTALRLMSCYSTIRNGNGAAQLAALRDIDQSISEELGEWPEVQLEISVALQRITRRLGFRPEAEIQGRKALAIATASFEPGSTEIASATTALAHTVLRIGRDNSRQECHALVEKILAQSRPQDLPIELLVEAQWLRAATLPTDDPSAIDELRKWSLFAKELLGPAHSLTVMSRRSLIIRLRRVDIDAALTEARALVDSAEFVGEAYRLGLLCRFALAHTLAQYGMKKKIREATQQSLLLYESVISGRTGVLGANHSGTLNARLTRCQVLLQLGREGESVDEMLDVLNLVTLNPLGPDDTKKYRDWILAMVRDVRESELRARLVDALQVSPS